MALQVSTLTSTATAGTINAAGVTVHSIAWSNTSTVDGVISLKDATTATGSAVAFSLGALRRHGASWRIAGGGKRFNTGLSATLPTSGVRLTVAFDDYL